MVIGGILGAMTSLFNRLRIHKKVTFRDVIVHFGIAACLLFVAWAICDIWQIEYAYRKVVYYAAGWIGPYLVSTVDAVVKARSRSIVEGAVDRIIEKINS